MSSQQAKDLLNGQYLVCPERADFEPTYTKKGKVKKQGKTVVEALKILDKERKKAQDERS